MATFKRLVYSKHGNPVEVLSIIEEPVPTELKAGEALVKILYSPINPSDYYVLMGQYPLKQTLPATVGLEGVAEVVKSSTGNFQPGDRVLVSTYGYGMWRQMGVVEEKNLNKMPKELPAELAATLIVNPCTAYLIMKKIVPMEAGDVLIQNAANSALGTLLIQFCKLSGIKTINVIRNRPNLQELVDKLKGLGADAVVTDEQLKEGLDKLNLDISAPKLALDAVGGEASAILAAALVDGGTMATYGILSGQPSQVGGSDLIFRDIKVRGFWLTKWMKENPEQTPKIIADVSGLLMSGKVRPPTFRKFPVEKYKEAVALAMKGFTDEKILIQLN